MTARKTYGQTRDGRPIDDAFIATLADEAERGYDVEQLANKPRGRGRPPLGHQAKTVGSVRLDPALREEAAQRADADGITVSEVVRRALREYLRSA
jgi:predicted HicB family RNase H-like nuclease